MKLKHISISAVFVAVAFVVPSVAFGQGLNVALEVPFGQTGAVAGLADYLSRLYTFIVTTIGIIAAVMIMFHGIQWAAAAGNSDIISKAKDGIVHAIIGVVLAFSSYLILYTINPALTMFEEVLLPSMALELSQTTGGAAGKALEEFGTYAEYKETEKELCDRIQGPYAAAANFQGQWDCGADSGTGPWSAIFISYVHKAAGVNFPYSTAHSVYINKSIQNKQTGAAGVKGYKPATRKVEVGDLVCYERGSGVTYDTAVATGSYASHCDIVYKVEGSVASALGGNLGDTIKETKYSVDGSGFINTPKIFIVISTK